MGHILWSAKDDDGVEVELSQNFDIDRGLERWNLEMTKGPFSGYPVLYLSKEDMWGLYATLKNELQVMG